MHTKSPDQQPSKAYNPHGVEERLYAWWESSGFFRPDPTPGKRSFTIVMPPPNATGELHIGHALTATIQDALTRYHRMLGEAALWVPGIDHAGIATQMVVERELSKQGIDRHQIGREAFVKHVWEWVNHHRSAIDNQHRRLGASCDWERRAFTLDEGPSRAVRTTFVNLYNKGLIYRGKRIINWCPSCRTAISDLEVDHSEEPGKLYHIRYLLENSAGPQKTDYVTVATTRPETLFGDTAVAVNPEDSRFHQVVGKSVLLPFLQKSIPIVQDAAVDPSFGTGALKVTPGHDTNDFDIGERLGLPVLNVLNPDGTLNENAGPFNGYDRFEARKLIVEQLEDLGQLEKVDSLNHSIGHCQRSGDIVEPIVSEQWFVKISPLANRAINAVTSGEIKIVPERFTKVYLNWLENLRDWCISRQLWWGHRIPVWYCHDCQHLNVRMDDPASCEKCASKNMFQDEDVLDTWFSSALWPHSTLGWPDNTEDLQAFYPTQVMETGYDILFFWVARMIMMGIENTGAIPFDTVFLHGLIRDEQGRKMSKTTGNVIDPIEAITKFGTDALRFALTFGTAPGNDSRLSPSKLEASRNFANKLWNAGRYLFSTLGDIEQKEGLLKDPSREHLEDRWILSELDRTTNAVHELWGSFQLGEAERVLQDFTWGQYCDWYIELAKVRIRDGDNSPRNVLTFVFERILRLLHPFMPFITEELWQQLKGTLSDGKSLTSSIMISNYPQASGLPTDIEAIKEMELVIELIKRIRNIRAELRIEPQLLLDSSASTTESGTVLFGESSAICRIGRLNTFSINEASGEQNPEERSVSFVVQGVTIKLKLSTIIDTAREIERIEADLQDSDKQTNRLISLLSDEKFIAKAPQEVADREQSRLEALRNRQELLQALLAGLKAG